MKICFIISAYCTKNGLLSPNWRRISARMAGLVLRPAMARAGSIPGVLKKITKVTAVITNMTATVQIVRRTMKVSMAATRPGRGLAATRPGSPAGQQARPSPLHPELRARVEGVPHPVSEHVQRQHREHDHDSGGDRHPRPGEQQVLPSLMIDPQLTFGGCTPMDRNDSADSVRIVVAIISGSSTITVATTFGRISEKISLRFEAPWAIAASTNSLLTTESTWPRTGR